MTNYNDEFIKAMEVMKKYYAKTSHLPTGIKVNEVWFKKQIENNFITFDNKERTLTGQVGRFNGLPVEIDDSIDTYELIYKQ